MLIQLGAFSRASPILGSWFEVRKLDRKPYLPCHDIVTLSMATPSTVEVLGPQSLKSPYLLDKALQAPFT
eukprot:1149281-Pelagomonas_calceolata.AAC.4